MSLYHFTCAHGCQKIGYEGVLLPLRDLLDKAARSDWEPWRLPIADLIWLTDLDSPFREALGLTSFTLGCDRTTYRYVVTDESMCRPYVAIRRQLPRELRAELESAEGAMPRHWWVSYAPVPVRYDTPAEAAA